MVQQESGLEAAAAEAVDACREAVAALSAAAVAPEALAEYVEARRVLLVSRPARMVPLGEAWRLGALLLGTDARLYALGRATRAAERGRPSYQSASREERRDIAAAALRGGYAVGAPVNYDARELPLTPAGIAGLDAADPIGVDPGTASGPGPDAPASSAPVVRVRWRAGASLEGAPSLRAYLGERVSLLVAPEFTD